MIRIAVVDDEEMICEQIERLLQECSNTIHVEFQIDIFYSGERLISELKNNQKYDLIFLDIELYKCNGVDVGHFIRDELCDDSTQIERLLQECSNTIHVEFQIDIFYSGERLISELKNNQKYDLIFLDIELYKCNGVDVGHFIRDELCDDSTQIAYISGKNGYDRLLFEFRPIHFIEKPATLGKIMNVITKYIRIYGQQGDVFNYKVNRDNYYADINQILYFKSNDRKVIIICKDDKDEFYGSIEKTAQQLKSKGFFMPHRSYLVNYRFVKCFQLKKIIMTNGCEIPISDNRREEVLKIQVVMENGGSAKKSL